jgi:uncharacterized membrane protein YGL010W
MLKPELTALFQSYDDSHRHPTNQLTHKFAIPLIVFHIIAMLSWVPLWKSEGLGFSFTAGHIAYVLAIGWYVTLNAKLAAIMAVLFALCFPLASIAPKPLVIAIAVVGWLVQLAGHSIWEKNRPAFLTNLLQALVGPLFFVAKITGDWAPAPRQAQPTSR